MSAFCQQTCQHKPEIGDTAPHLTRRDELGGPPLTHLSRWRHGFEPCWGCSLADRMRLPGPEVGDG